MLGPGTLLASSRWMRTWYLTQSITSAGHTCTTFLCVALDENGHVVDKGRALYVHVCV